MAAHNELGKKGEDLAASWLPTQGFDILNRNWYSAPYELDIIAKKNNIIHFIEVKTSNSKEFGYPEERVSRYKLKKMMEGATLWLYQNSITSETRIQYDVLSIIVHQDRQPEFTLFTDVSL